MKQFTWVDTYKEIAKRLLHYETRQKELINVLKSIGINRFRDIDKSGHEIELEEIDPFTFFSYLNKYKKNEHRLEFLQQLHQEWQLQSQLPEDVEGIPTSHPLKVWLFEYKKDRNPSTISLLWELYKQTIERNINNELLQKVLQLPCIGKGKLSICWFYTDPEYYIPLDSNTSSYLREKQFRYIYGSYTEYEELRREAVAKFKTPYNLSIQAWEFKIERNLIAQTELEQTNEQIFNSLAKNSKSSYQNVPSFDDEIKDVQSLMNLIEDTLNMDSYYNVFYRGQSELYDNVRPGIYRENRIELEEHKFKEMESSTPTEFRTCANTFEKLVKMQHYAFPTRLVDITSNSLVALYFACRDMSDKNGVLYMLDVSKDDIKYYDSEIVSIISNITLCPKHFNIKSFKNDNEPTFQTYLRDIGLYNKIHREKPYFTPNIRASDLEKIVCVKPRMDNPRIIKQDGAFLLFGISEEKVTYASFEERYKYKMFEIKASNKERILKQLKALGICESSLFPEIDYVAKEINRKYSV